MYIPWYICKSIEIRCHDLNINLLLLLGVPVILLCENLIKKIDSLAVNSDVPITDSNLKPPERLEWAVEVSEQTKIQAATLFVDELTKDLDCLVYR